MIFDNDRTSFSTREICVVSERCLQLGRILGTSNAVRRRVKEERHDPSWSQHIVHRLSERIVDVDSPKEKLDQIAGFVNQLLGASATHIWPVVWRSSEFENIEIPKFDISEGGFASMDTGLLFNDEEEVGRALAPREEGLSVRLLRGELPSPYFIRDAKTDGRVGDTTRNAGFGSLVGTVVQGPVSYRPEGLIWIRFPKQLGKTGKMPKALRQNVEMISSFVHLLWRPSTFACPMSHVQSDAAERI